MAASFLCSVEGEEGAEAGGTEEGVEQGEPSTTPWQEVEGTSNGGSGASEAGDTFTGAEGGNGIGKGHESGVSKGRDREGTA